MNEVDGRTQFDGRESECKKHIRQFTEREQSAAEDQTESSADVTHES